jgi:hypothetical protein
MASPVTHVEGMGTDGSQARDPSGNQIRISQAL